MLPILPNQIREIIPPPGGSFCEKFLASLKFPKLFYQLFKFFVGEDGKLTTEGAAYLCNIECVGGTSGTGGVPGAPAISASDGTFLNKVQITWTTIAGSSSYEVFRNTTNSTSTSILIGTTAGTSFDDTTAVPGTTYFYWVRAKTGSVAGPFSAVDTGFAATAIAAVSDLDATQGFARFDNRRISLVWTPVTGATSYDIYRGATSNFADAAKIDSDRVPYDNSEVLSNGPNPTFLDNGGELLYIHVPPDAWATYYFWVVPKATGAIGPESNAASGFSSGWGDGTGGTEFLLEVGVGETAVVTGGTDARVVLFGGGGNGAGAGGLRGGGGAGAGATVYGEMTLSGATPTFRITNDAIAARATSEQNGSVVPGAVLEFAPDGAAWVTKATSDVGLVAPLYSASAAGTGGDGASGSSAGLTNNGVKDGRPGRPSSGNNGGRSGYRFGAAANQGAHFPGSNAAGTYGFSGDGQIQGNPAGSGSYAAASDLNRRTGGLGSRGYALVWVR